MLPRRYVEFKNYPGPIDASLDDQYDFWMNPDPDNVPVKYLKGYKRSRYLVELIRRHADPDSKFLELGCNAGRNLNALWRAGYRNLTGVDISPAAIEMLERTYPYLKAKIYVSPAESVIRAFQDQEFDVIYTMAVLEHIHTSSEGLFPEMARVSRRFVITIEDEVSRNWCKFPRNYHLLFERLGLRQIEAHNCRDVEGLGERFFARVFEHA